MRGLQSTVSADSSDPVFAPGRNRMNNEVIEPLLSNSDHHLNLNVRPNSSSLVNDQAFFWHRSGFLSALRNRVGSPFQWTKKVLDELLFTK
jgi:hypothetical protein